MLEKKNKRKVSFYDKQAVFQKRKSFKREEKREKFYYKQQVRNIFFQEVWSGVELTTWAQNHVQKL